MFQHKKVVLAITGGIAVYRVAELARLLMRQGAQVRCVMTASACEFVTPLTFEALTGEAVHTELFNLTHERNMGHIALARWADAVVVTPASANILAKLAHGIADDLLTTMVQVCDVPLMLAPAMNPSMWQSAATQNNIHLVQQRGWHVLPPTSGVLACGEEGAGRLPEPEAIAEALLPVLHKPVLQGQRWVINAGPTVEAWDAVRVLSNRASGDLGVALARVAAAYGADVCLIAGGGRVAQTAEHIQRIEVMTALQMYDACMDNAVGADVFIATAAVSDFRFADVQQDKMKRGDTTHLSVDLCVNPDVVAAVASMSERPNKVIAFAAESQHHLDYAQEKLHKKKVDAVVVNDVANMGSDVAGGWWLTAHGHQTLPAASKQAWAKKIIQATMGLETI